MEYTVAQFSWPQGEAKQADDRPAEVETEINKQRRKVQNRKNQRAHRKSTPRYYNPCYTQKPLQDYGSRAETRGLFRSRAHSRSGAGASTSSTTVPVKKSRWHQSAQQPRLSPLNRLTRTQAYHPPQPNVPSSAQDHYPLPTSTQPQLLTPSPLLFPSPRTTSSISSSTTSFAP